MSAELELSGRDEVVDVSEVVIIKRRESTGVSVWYKFMYTQIFCLINHCLPVTFILDGSTL